ncbi:hypothetical protein OIU34_16740 [Pararhizobium sp. BT-229]|uniref:hypothetical protein n=1 Tax=Pararhizobium sp. BT-229 TaxID=2986923 RepID=UPI0021F7160E|nr:hypothetical protein [Pararhizobium sp. BT-229]MCV9963552.1 hypothetical protein [Pararhizobium sp. BT-229]
MSQQAGEITHLGAHYDVKDGPVDVRELRAAVMREVKAQDIWGMTHYLERDYEDVPLDCGVIHFWSSTSLPAERDKWLLSAAEEQLNMALVRGIDRSARVISHKATLLGWLHGTMIVSTDLDAHEKLVGSITDIIPRKARKFAVADAIRVTEAFLADYWGHWADYLRFRKMLIDVKPRVDAAKYLAKAAEYIAASREALQQEMPDQLLTAAESWPGSYLALKKVYRQLTDDRDAAYTATVQMRAAERRVYNPPR